MEEDEFNELEPCELFVMTSGDSMQFSIKICPEKIRLQKIVENCGGQLHAKAGGPNTIRLLPIGDRPTQDEVFSSKYIYDCVRSQELKDLNKYRINKKSLYTDDVDVMNILLGNFTWADCTRSGMKHSDVVSDFSDIDDDSSSPTRQTKLKSGRREYTHGERNSIVTYIIENRRYNEVKAKNLWTDMEAANICPGRTWHSLKEHFRNTIVYKLNEFGLPDKQIKRLSYKFTDYHLRENLPSSSSSEDNNLSSSKDVNKSQRKGTHNLSSSEDNNLPPSKDVNQSQMKVTHNLNTDTETLDKSGLSEINEESSVDDSEIKDKEFKGNRIQEENNGNSRLMDINDEEFLGSTKKKVQNASKEVSDHNQSSIIQTQKNIEEMQELLNEIPLPAVPNAASNTEVSHDITGDNSVFYSCQGALLSNENNESSSSGEEIPNSESENELCSPKHYLRDLNKIDSDAETVTFYSETENKIVGSPSKRQKRRTPNKLKDSNAHTLLSISEAERDNSPTSSTKRRLDEQISCVSPNIDSTQCHNVSKEIEYFLTEKERSPHVKKNNQINDLVSPSRKILNLKIPNADGGSSPESEVEVKRHIQNRRRSGLTPKKSSTSTNSFNHQSPDAVVRKTKEENSSEINSSSDERSSEKDENIPKKKSKIQNKKNNLQPRAILSSTDESESNDDSEEVELFSSTECLSPGSGDNDDKEADQNQNISVVEIGKTGVTNTSHNDDSETDYGDVTEDEDIEDNEKANTEDIEIVKIPPSSSKVNRDGMFLNYDNMTGRYDRTYYPKNGKRKKINEESPNKRRKWDNMKGHYTVYEDMDILIYINQHKGFQEFGGNNLWIAMENSGVIPGRSWLSLKERFRMRILRQLDSYLEHGLEQVVYDKFNQYKKVKEENPIESEDLKPMRDKKYSHQDDIKILRYIEEKNAYEMVGGRKIWQDMVESDILYSRSWLSLKERYRRVIIQNLNVYKAHGFSERQLNLFKRPEGGSDKTNKKPRGTHTPYAHKEDQDILNFIVKCKGYSEVGGKTLWLKMTISEELKGRTWLSLKERFRKRIIHNLNNFDLTEEEKKYLINKTSIKHAVTSPRRIPKGPGYKTSRVKKQKELKQKRIYSSKEPQPSTSGYRPTKKQKNIIDSSDEFVDSNQEDANNSNPELSNKRNKFFRMYSPPNYPHLLTETLITTDKISKTRNLSLTDSKKKNKNDTLKTYLDQSPTIVKKNLLTSITDNSTRSPHSPKLNCSTDSKVSKKVGFNLIKNRTIYNNEKNSNSDEVIRNVECFPSEIDHPASPSSSTLNNDLPDISEVLFDIDETTLEKHLRNSNLDYESQSEQKDVETGEREIINGENEIMDIGNPNQDQNETIRNAKESEDILNETQNIEKGQGICENQSDKCETISENCIQEETETDVSTKMNESKMGIYNLRQSPRKSNLQLFRASPRKSIILSENIEITNNTGGREIGNGKNKIKDIGNHNQDQNEKIINALENEDILNETQNIEKGQGSCKNQSDKCETISGNFIQEEPETDVSTKMDESKMGIYNLRQSPRKSNLQLFRTSPRKSLKLSENIEITNENTIKEMKKSETIPNVRDKVTRNGVLHDLGVSNQKQEYGEMEVSNADESNKVNKTNPQTVNLDPKKAKNMNMSNDSTEPVEVESKAENYNLRRSIRKSDFDLHDTSPRKKSKQTKSVEITDENTLKGNGNDNNLNDSEIDIEITSENESKNISELSDNETNISKLTNQIPSKIPSNITGKSSLQKFKTPIKNVSPHIKSFNDKDNRANKNIDVNLSSKYSPKKDKTPMKIVTPIRKTFDINLNSIKKKTLIKSVNSSKKTLKGLKQSQIVRNRLRKKPRRKSK